ncbi:peroxisomal catalase [Clavispora lusitaniae ATCC 42720]|uniref:Peroxisomal catalase n=1 Tax=Clavispora lusitaniae (strain ATCC 42720) TaxID=306902 RepID=C4YCC6_CLAL4|nr:peroxisomal catalase [Clavispora lusitaniae ATCC 42720]EEQ41638.1 peroxisomal catalase [Clavispora lusitaniae ATCC 42720]
MDCNVVGQVSSSAWVSSQNIVQRSCSSEFSVGSLPVEWTSSAAPHLSVLLETELAELNGLAACEVVWRRTQVTIDIHDTISHVRVEHAGDRTVDWDSSVVGSQSVSVSVCIREQSRLQHWVSGRFHVWHGVGRRECRSFDLSKVVLGVFVQGELTETAQGVILVWPDLCQVKDREWSLLGSLSSHGSDVAGPAREVSVGNVAEQILLGMVRVLARQLASLFVGQSLDASVRDEVHLHVVPVAILSGPLVCVARVTVHLTVRSWGTTVREQRHDSVDRLFVRRQVVPEHVGVLQVGLRVPLSRVDEVRELGRVTDEKHRRVVVHKIQVAFFRVQLGGETTRVSGRVSRPQLTAHSGETREHLGFLAHGVQKLGGTNVCDVVGHFENTIGARTFGMDHSFGDSLAVKVRQRVDQIEVSQQQGTVLAHSLGSKRFRNRTSVGIGEGRWCHCSNDFVVVEAGQLRRLL